MHVGLFSSYLTGYFTYYYFHYLLHCFNISKANNAKNNVYEGKRDTLVMSFCKCGDSHPSSLLESRGKSAAPGVSPLIVFEDCCWESLGKVKLVTLGFASYFFGDHYI